MTDAIVSGSGDTQMADQDLCIAVGEDLTATFPGYVWAVGCDHQAGVLNIRLILDADALTSRRFGEYGYLLHISSVLGPGGQKKVRNAGGEVLERYGLPRTRAPQDVSARAVEHGLDLDAIVTKSRH